MVQMISDCLDNGIGTVICSADKCVARMIRVCSLANNFSLFKVCDSCCGQHRQRENFCD